MRLGGGNMYQAELINADAGADMSAGETSLRGRRGLVPIDIMSERKRNWEYSTDIVYTDIPSMSRFKPLQCLLRQMKGRSWFLVLLGHWVFALSNKHWKEASKSSSMYEVLRNSSEILRMTKMSQEVIPDQSFFLGNPCWQQLPNSRRDTRGSSKSRSPSPTKLWYYYLKHGSA